MSIDDDVALLERVPTLRLLGIAALRVIAIYVVQNGAFRISLDDGSDHEVIAGPGTLIGELALLVAMQRPSTAVATEYSSTIRITRSLFQRVLDSDPAAARRLRDDMATRVSQLASDVTLIGAKLSQ